MKYTRDMNKGTTKTNIRIQNIEIDGRNTSNDSDLTKVEGDRENF